MKKTERTKKSLNITVMTSLYKILYICSCFYGFVLNKRITLSKNIR